jgi:UPF0755 protein
MKKLLIAAIVLVSSAAIGVLTLFFLWGYFNSPPPDSTTVTLSVKSGMTVRTVADILEDEHVIRNSDFFVLLSKVLKNSTILTGNYTIYQGSSSKEIFEKLSSGSVQTARVTIPEGFNLFQMAPLFDEAGICSKEKFIFYVQDREFLLSLGINALSAEGYLFPDTYAFAHNSDTRDVIRHMKQKMDDVLNGLNYQSALPDGMNVHQLLIIASLVEKEARVKSEQKLVASVFLNRVKNKMRFDSDPTVRYAVKKFKGRITYRDLDSNSPYNTYKVWGYPPTPIASPGKGAIEAVLYPVESNYLYFVARNDGTHYFSKTLSRHNKAVSYYQRGENNGFYDDQL